MGEINVTLFIHFGGTLVEHPKVSYTGGQIAETRVDNNTFTYVDLRGILQELGCSSQMKLFYKAKENRKKKPLVEINGDLGPMFALYGVHAEIDIYVIDPLWREDSDVDSDEESDREREIQNMSGMDDSSDDDLVDDATQPTDQPTQPTNEPTDPSEPTVKPTDPSEPTVEPIEPTVEPTEHLEPHQAAVDIEMETCDSSDDQRRADESDDDRKKKRKKKMREYIEFNEDKHMKHPILIEGMIFPNVVKFRALLKEWHIREGYEYKCKKNESSRVTVVCVQRPECMFRLHASPTHDRGSFQIKKIDEDHCCGRTYDNKLATSTWISKKYTAKLNDTPNWQVGCMKKEVRREWMINASDLQIYRARQKAQELIQGNFQEQYLRLRDYCGMIMKTNPGSKAILQVEKPWVDSVSIFERMFVIYDAQIKGFLEGCRPIIGLDACFLKGPYGGQLLHATGRDGNNQMYPLALAVVEAENKSSWEWFLGNLISKIGTPQERGWTFISDRQKVFL